MISPRNSNTQRLELLPKTTYILIGLALVLSPTLTLRAETRPASSPAEVLERSYWVHASLGETMRRGYWGPGYSADTTPSAEEIGRAAKLLTGPYGANRLYLIYHQEIPLDDAQRVFLAWRAACPREVDLVPTLVTRMYDRDQTLVFTADELKLLASFFRRQLHATHIGIYDVYPNRDLEQQLALLEKEFPRRLIRVGIQPDEKIDARYAWVVQDTWSGFCHGKTNEDWLSPGFGADTLRAWVLARAKHVPPIPVSWDLIVVAWDYLATERGGYPGYDDASKNMPLPAGRNRLALREIAAGLPANRWKGVSSDLFILHANSRNPKRDGLQGSFHGTLRRGEHYRGFFAEPFEEITQLYRELRENPRLASQPAVTTHPSRSR